MGESAVSFQKGLSPVAAWKGKGLWFQTLRDIPGTTRSLRQRGKGEMESMKKVKSRKGRSKERSNQRSFLGNIERMGGKEKSIDRVGSYKETEDSRVVRGY